MRKPRPLHSGDKVAIVSLSSGMLGEDFSKHTIEKGIKRLKEFGLEPVFMPNALKGIQFLKNHPELRAKDLKDAFADPNIKGIICAIGGDDTYRTLPYLLEDKEFIESVHSNPKIFTGFSDTTINHLMFHKLGMVSFYGPNFVCDLAELDKDMLPYTKKEFYKYLSNNDDNTIDSSDIWYEERKDFSASVVDTSRIVHKEDRGYEVLQGSGMVKGRFLGGCLESLYDILTVNRYEDEVEICEKYGLFPSLEEWKDNILFIETCEEQPTPDLFEKELSALKSRGIFEVINGIIVGKPQNEVYYQEYKKILCNVVDNKELPIMYNVNFGHAYPRCVLPYGIDVEIDLDIKTISFNESFLSKR